jgi:Asp/Glu/hydantoin racemase
MLTAMSLGSKFSIITMWEKWFHLYEKTINDLGINSSLASIRSIDVTPDNQALLDGKEEEIFPLLEIAANKAIEHDKAEVIILGSTTMHQAHSFLSSRLPVPIINPGPLTYKKAEMLLSSNLSHSRKAYPTSPADKSSMLKAMLKTASSFKH